MGFLKRNTKKEDSSVHANQDDATQQLPERIDYIVPDVETVTPSVQQQQRKVGAILEEEEGEEDENYNRTKQKQQQQQQQQRNHRSSTLQDNNSNTCYKRLCYEIYPFRCDEKWFSVYDPMNGRIIDIPESFAPPTCTAFIYKFLYCTLCMFTIFYTVYLSPDYNKGTGRLFYLAYLTNWGSIFSCSYSIFSLLNTIMASRTGQPQIKEYPTTETTTPTTKTSVVPSFRIVCTWILYSVASCTTFMTMLLYWPLQFDPQTTDLSYSTIVPHGVIFIFTIIDGNYINRIPVRIIHWYGFVLPFNLLYLIWTVIQQFFDELENPESDTDPSTNDDAIYPGVIEWSTNWETSLFWSCITFFIISPVLYILIWMLSFGYCCNGGCCCCTSNSNNNGGNTKPASNDTWRKYIDSIDPNDNRPTVDDVEEGSIFATWR